ncbi:MAG: hypothetical protein HFH85_16745 [Lachnospiraceae bacterium]|jgi:hypothetical protein|nr:hypothetical protein [Lachnospiraceae bacterium]
MGSSEGEVIVADKVTEELKQLLKALAGRLFAIWKWIVIRTTIPCRV